MNKIKLWLRILRAPFFTATLLSGFLAGAAVWHSGAKIDLQLYLWTLLGILAVHSGTNMANDYFDHRSGLDAANRNPTPFSGGSRVIQQGLVKPETVRNAFIICFCITVLIGVYLHMNTPGTGLLWIGISGILIALFYTARPIRLAYTPVGEILTGIGCGPLIVMGTWYVQAPDRFPVLPLLISVPIGILVAMILYINEFPDYPNDKKAGKKNWVILLGRKKAAAGYIIIMSLVYVYITTGVLLGWFPVYSLAVWLTLPVLIGACRTVLRFPEHPKKILPANAATIRLHMIIGLLLTISFILDKWLPIRLFS